MSLNMVFSRLSLINLLIAPFTALANVDNGLRLTNETHDLTEDSFDAVISKTPHFVLFFEPDCPSCKILLETWQSLSSEINERTNERLKLMPVV